MIRPDLAAPDYTPPAVDLSPFRVGTVWHYHGLAYLVTDCGFHERAGQHVDRLLTGAPAEVVVGQDGPAEVRMTLDRADWADAYPIAGCLDGFDEYGDPRWLFIDPGHCWQVADFNRIMLFAGPVVLARGTDTAGEPSQLQVTLWRRPDQDLASSP